MICRHLRRSSTSWLLLLLVTAVSTTTTCWGFTPAARKPLSSPRAATAAARTVRRLVPIPDQLASLSFDPNVLGLTADQMMAVQQTALTAWLDHHVQAGSSQWLADAAAAAAAEAGDDGGWWQAFINIFKHTLTFVHSVISPLLNKIGIENTWGISIAVFTFSIRSLLIPLSVQQSKSAEYMKALKPYMSQIRAKYKDSQDAQNRAVAKLYEDAQQNPLAGCLVSLAQLPVFLGLYRGVNLLAKDGELQEPFLWIPSLEGPVTAESDYRGLDWLIKGWTSNPGDGFPFIPSLGWETTLAFLVMPVVLVVLQSITMSAVQPPLDETATEAEKETNERTQGIMKFLPLLIGFFSLQVPAGLTIYWFTSNIFTLTQSLAVRAYFAANPPQIELPEYWDTALSQDADFEKMTPEERRQAAQAGIRVGPTMEELIDEQRFHILIERRSFREETEAWERATAMEISIPEEMKDWVGSSSATKHTVAVPSSSLSQDQSTITAAASA